MFVKNNKVNAHNLESQSFNGVNDVNLYNLTNTFSYKYDSVTSIDFRNEERYDFSKPTGIIVDEKASLLTVFTHGLGGSASHWSNDGNDNFAYSDNSLVTRLAKLIDSNIYWSKFDNLGNLELIDITDEFNDFSKNKINAKYTTIKKIDSIIDIFKHGIVVLEATNKATNGANDLVYTEFNYAISKIVYDIRVLNKGVLPKIKFCNI